MKQGDVVVFTDEAKRELGRYADNLVHTIESITVSKVGTIATFKNEVESECDVIWLKILE